MSEPGPGDFIPKTIDQQFEAVREEIETLRARGFSGEDNAVFNRLKQKAEAVFEMKDSARGIRAQIFVIRALEEASHGASDPVALELVTAALYLIGDDNDDTTALGEAWNMQENLNESKKRNPEIIALGKQCMDELVEIGTRLGPRKREILVRIKS